MARLEKAVLTLYALRFGRATTRVRIVSPPIGKAGALLPPAVDLFGQSVFIKRVSGTFSLEQREFKDSDSAHGRRPHEREGTRAEFAERSAGRRLDVRGCSLGRRTPFLPR
jgi:hypothetical protein